uniref:Uncharacterized protein n=1 Tax=Rhizophora mucronata TaxID=61149 RepID=A0A2P2PCP6_RHIMU
MHIQGASKAKLRRYHSESNV